MKRKVVNQSNLNAEGRWDIDYHLPAEGIKKYPSNLLHPVSKAAVIVKAKKDPTKKPDEMFRYIDISCVETSTGTVTEPQELTGSEAPSRARKLVQAYDLIISTCRPTRGAIAVVPEQYHNEICSTGFSVIRPKKGVNPFYLHFALRLSSSLEQFRKFSTGSSYPAILDSDVLKTQIPLPDEATQNKIAAYILSSLKERRNAIYTANSTFHNNVELVIESLIETSSFDTAIEFSEHSCATGDIINRINELAPSTPT
ncbi:restriction endonuclease subunit S [Photobacterium sp. GB-36]|uniref:restriction endonuclease subunit S n=1 Tax=Photobacterium sp. GB-36 TaxID=2022108 RepID=UPI000D168607|nr:restriction endonuclease subunit S [Photobacterium sp. GB-36]PSV43253.1 hypothetical protein C9J46_12400 [Photobacterium sp. GB-36]